MESQESSSDRHRTGAQSQEFSASLEDLARTAERLLEAARQFKASE